MNNIAQLICDYVDANTFYRLKDDYKLSEKLYWTNQKISEDLMVFGSLQIITYLYDNGYFTIRPKGRSTSLGKIDQDVKNKMIICAIYRKSLDILRYLHQSGFTFTYEHATCAIEKDDVDTLDFLFKHGCDMQCPDDDHTLTEYCLEYESSKCIEYLAI